MREEVLPLFVVALPSFLSASIFEQASRSRCGPITDPICQDAPYNYTYFPNSLVQPDQQSHQTQTEHFKPLIKTKCNPALKFFICSVFWPMCPEDLPQPVTSCRSVCEEVKKDCISILQEYGIEWPEPLNCSKFPEEPSLCMKPTKDRESNEPLTGSVSDHSISKSPTCPDDLINLDPQDAKSYCAFKCGRKGMFENRKKDFARFWMLLWATINLGITAFTVLTFLIDRQRFRFPERSIFYLSACYMLFSLPWLSRAFLEYERIACDRLPGSNEQFLIVGTLDNTSCVTSFILTYYFSMASSLWWLMLTFTWYLSAARKWVPEGIDAWSSYLHLVAWALPALLTITVLTTHKVDASELTGICSVGNLDPWALLGFVIIPKLAFVIVGSCLIIAGFSSMCRERDSFRRRGTDTSKLEKLMVKMGIFSALYVIPAITMVVCDSYHMFVLMQWHPATTACKSFGGAEKGHCRKPPLPQAELYILNIFMSLAVGISTGMWIVSSKTFYSWQRVLCCGLCSTAPAKGSLPGAVPLAASRPLIPAVNPPPPPNLYVPLTMSSVPSSHITTSKTAWKQSKVV